MLLSNTFKELLTEAARRFGEDPFLIDDPDLGPVSYSDLLRFANGVETQFDEWAIPVGAPVAMLMHNCGLAALLFLSVIASRRMLVPLNPLSTAYELQHLLERAQCGTVITQAGLSVNPRSHDRRVVEIADPLRYFSERWGERGYPQATPDFAGLVGEVVFTSGSTGHPKGVVLSEGSLIANARALAGVYDLHRGDRFLTVCPLFHNSGQVFTTLACLLAGGSTVAVKSDVGMLNFWSYMNKYRANWSLGMTSFLALLLARHEAPDAPGGIRGILTGGSAIDAGMVAGFESRFGVPVRTIYGLTETSSISTCEYLDPNPRSLGSSGRPLSICKVKIDRTEQNHAPGTAASNRSGQILISGSNVFEGYLGDSDLTRKRKRDGWVHTGDVGYFDDNGNLFVIDRLDSMLIVGGENVYPAEVERLCVLLPGATQIVLTGIDHPLWGKELVLVYAARNEEVPSIQTWHRVLTEHLASAKLPQRYVSVQQLGLQEFPRKENGKLDRQAVAALLRSKLVTGAPERTSGT